MLDAAATEAKRLRSVLVEALKLCLKTCRLISAEACSKGGAHDQTRLFLGHWRGASIIRHAHGKAIRPT